jgi:hypothetical protein
VGLLSGISVRHMRAGPTAAVEGALPSSPFGIRLLRLRRVFIPPETRAIEQQRNMVEDVPAENATLLVDDQVLAFEEALQK